MLNSYEDYTGAGKQRVLINLLRFSGKLVIRFSHVRVTSSFRHVKYSTKAVQKDLDGSNIGKY